VTDRADGGGDVVAVVAVVASGLDRPPRPILAQ